MNLGGDNQRTDVPMPNRHLVYGSAEFFTAKLEEALGVANGQPLTFADLMHRVRTIWIDSDRQLVIKRVEQMAQLAEQSGSGDPQFQLHRRLPEQRQEQLAQALSHLVSVTDELQAPDRNRVDGAVGRLSRLLVADCAWSVVGPWFGDPRAFRLRVVVRVLLELGVPEPLAASVVEQYRATQDYGLLKLISLNPRVASLLDENDVLRVLALPANDYQIGPFSSKDRETRYRWMRAIETYLVGGHVPSDDIGFDYPMEFVWSVGRQSHRASLPLLRRVLLRHQADPEFLWRCMRAFDRVGDAADIARIRALASKAVDAAKRNISPDVAAYR